MIKNYFLNMSTLAISKVTKKNPKKLCDKNIRNVFSLFLFCCSCLVFASFSNISNSSTQCIYNFPPNLKYGKMSPVALWPYGQWEFESVVVWTTAHERRDSLLPLPLTFLRWVPIYCWVNLGVNSFVVDGLSWARTHNLQHFSKTLLTLG